MIPEPIRLPDPGPEEPGPPAPWVRATPFGDRAYLLEPGAVPARGGQEGGQGAGGEQAAGGEPAGAATAWVLPVVSAAQDRWPAATVVAGLASVLVAFDSPVDRPDEASLLGGWSPPPHPGAAPDTGTRVLRIPIRYDGPDLADVARDLGLTAAELAARHRAAEWTVAALGFSPGFGYLSCPDPLFRSVPRRAAHRRRVPAGSLAIAAGMSAIYPSATPGGWNLIGTTDAVLFDVGRVPPALLGVGDLVVFQEQP